MTISKTERAIEIIQTMRRRMEAGPLGARFMKTLALDTSRNETVLWHGAPREGARDAHGKLLFPDSASPLEAIKTHGFDDRLGNAKGMYGSGTYFADHSSKADQYAGRYHSPGESSVGTVASMFLARVTMGSPYLTNQSLEQLRRPPCIQNHFDENLLRNEKVELGKAWKEKEVECQLCSHRRFDSLLADLTVDDSRKLYHEYVVYRNQCYPEYCVTYRRLA